jgi:phosphatidate cytidylyltransferase
VRLFTAAIIVPAILALFWLDFFLGREDVLGRPGLVLFACAIIVSLMTASEVLHFDQANASRRIRREAVYCGTLVVVLLAFVPVLYDEYPADCPVGRPAWLAFAVAAAIGISFASQMALYRKGDRVMDDVARTLLTIMYAGVLIGFWSLIRGQFNNAWGLVALLSLFVPVKLSDTLAYTFGRLWGRHKFSPELSPGKTLEGVWGGFAGGILGAAIVLWLVAPWLTGDPIVASWWAVILFGSVVTAAGILGDLAESMMKRDGGVKNSSRWLPGLGGISDMIDSLLAAGPVVFAFWVSGLLGPMSS